MDLEEYATKLGVDLSKEAFARSKAIDRELKLEKKEIRRQIRLLLLGCGDSGKSTFAKQLELQYFQEPNTDELQVYVDILRDNSLTSMHSFINSCENIGYDLPKSLGDDVENVVECTYLTPEVARAISKIWANTEVKELWTNRASIIHLPSNAEYYFENIERFAADGFTPTQADIIRARSRTTGVIESKFQVDGLNFALVDVGGQRSERKKWIHFFDSVTAVIFMAALDEYDMTLEEDAQVNRMTESLKLFSDITKNSSFENTPFVLFLNKYDLFKQKLEDRRIPIQTLFPMYEGASTAEEVSKFIQSQFQKQYGGKKPLVIHTTCVLDKSVCLNVFESVRNSVVKPLLESAKPPASPNQELKNLPK